MALQRIRKDVARRRYNAGESVTVVSCNFMPGGPWALGSLLSLPKDAARYAYAEDASEMDFDRRVREYEFHNCPDAETGRYAAFYVGA